MYTLDFFSSSVGLGHITRDIAIANNLENISTTFVTGGVAVQILKNLDFRVQDVYHPPSFMVENGTLKDPENWSWRTYQHHKKCVDISQKIIKNDNPNLVIGDGDFASLSIAQNLKIPTVLVTDILETRFTDGLGSSTERKMNKLMNEIIKKCDLVIIPEKGTDYDNIKKVGPIVRRINLSRDDLRKKFSFEKKTILISIGGTNAGVFLIEKALESILKINQDVEVILVSGPTVNKKFKNVRNLGFVDNLHELIFAADLLIALAGKSTIDEANTYGTPAIFMPIKGHFEQEDNAKDEGFVFEDIERLDLLILEKLEQKRNPISTNGAEIAANIIKKLIN